MRTHIFHISIATKALAIRTRHTAICVSAVLLFRPNKVYIFYAFFQTGRHEKHPEKIEERRLRECNRPIACRQVSSDFLAFFPVGFLCVCFFFFTPGWRRYDKWSRMRRVSVLLPVG